MPRKTTHPRFTVERLECRTTPAVVSWDGGGGDFNWGTAANWTGDVLPGATDNAVIDLGANDFTVVYSGGYTFVSGLSCQANLMIAGGILDTGGGTSGGSFEVAAGAALGLAGQTLTGTSSVSGAGRVVLSSSTVGGTYHVTGGTEVPDHGGRVDFTGTVTSVGPDLAIRHAAEADFRGNPVAVDTLTLGNGTFRSAAPLTVSRSLTADGHAWLAGPSTATVGAGATLTIRSFGLNLSERVLVNRGAAAWESGRVVLWNAAEFRNEGTLAIGSTADWFYSAHGGPVGALVNTGTITRAAGTGGVLVDNTRFDNHGAVVVGAGGFYAGGGTSGGSFEVAAGAALGLAGQTLTATSRVTGGGRVDLGFCLVEGAYNVTGPTFVPFGTVTFSGANGPVTSSFNALTVFSGTTVRTSNELIVGGDFSWAGSTFEGLSGSGSLTVLGDMTLNGNYSLINFHLINAADAVWTAGSVNFYGANSRFTNLAGATFEDRAGGHFGSADSHCPVFDNAGLFLKTSAGVTDLHMQLVNSGTVQINAGVLNVDCGIVQVTTNTNAGSSSGTISGSYTGDVTTAVVNSGPVTADPTPTPPPPVTSYTQTAAGSLTVRIGGLTPGTGYGQIVVTGDVNLAGSLAVALINGFTPQVDDTFTIIDNRGANAVAGAFAGLPEGSTLKVGSVTYQISYLGGTGNDVVLSVLSVNAPPTADAGGTYSVGEGGSLTLAGSGSDPDQSANTLTYEWDLDDDGQFDDATGTNPAFSAALLDGFSGASHTVRLRVTDSSGVSDTSTATVNITNADPTATISGPTTGQQGTGLAFGSGVTDPGVADTAAGFTRSWQVARNGTPIDLTGLPTSAAAFAFTPADAGTYTVSLTATDKDGGATTETHTVVVSATPGVTKVGGRLVIVGTAGDDDILVNPGGGAPEIKVKFNGVQTVWVGVTDIVIFANAGDDRVQVAGGMTLPVVAFGGTGNDRLKAGGGPSVLAGGDGDDTLLGGSGRDILIGGAGADLIGGQGSDDLLVAGATAFDANLTALGLIRDEWTSARSFADRVANLSGTGTTGVNGPAVVRATSPAATVFDDGAVDLLAGGAGNDWFVFNSTGSGCDDFALDLTAFEGLFDIDL